MEDQSVSEFDVRQPIFHRIDLAVGGEVADADILKESLIGADADEVSLGLTSFQDSGMTVEILAVAGPDRRRRRCRRKRKAGEHHRAPPLNEPTDRRRRPIRIWKPYTDMTWEERLAKDEMDASRAARRRDRRFASGQAMAPDNTTQFLMEQYDVESRMRSQRVALNEAVRPRGDSDEAVTFRPRTPESSVTGGESTSAADDVEEERIVQEELFFLEQEFNEAYDRQHAERLDGMTKDELIRDYIQMEESLELLQSRLNSVTATGVSASATATAPPTTRTMTDSGIELRRLREENARLIRENTQLRFEMSTLTSATMTMTSVVLSA